MSANNLGASQLLSGPPRLVFAIPLKPRAACSDWAMAQAYLRRTIKSALTAAESYAAEVWVASHEQPDLGDLRATVRVCPVPFPVPLDPIEGGLDKARKRRFIGACLREHVVRDVSVVFLDADDLVHRDLVRYVLADGGGSYVVDDGYVYDTRARVLQRYPANFHRRCGSSFVFRFSADELPETWEDLDAAFSQFGTSPERRGHQDYERVAAELGRPAAPIPFPGCVYVVNHSESLWTAQTGGHLRINRRPLDVVKPSLAREILRDDFSSADYAARVAGPARYARATSAAVLVAGRTKLLRVFGIAPPSILPTSAVAVASAPVPQKAVAHKRQGSGRRTDQRTTRTRGRR